MAVMAELLSRASINAYLPYSKVPYKESEVSANADRCELYRKRKAAEEEIIDSDTLWNALLLFQGYKFHTITGLQLSYEKSTRTSGDEKFVQLRRSFFLL